jgi:hypothetical protein
VRDDGFRPIDLVDVLRPSPRHITIDWRDALEDVFMELTRAFESHGFDTSCDSTFVGEGRRETGVIRLGSHGIEFERTREGIVDFKQRLRELEIATSDALAFRLNDGSDTCVLALLRHEDWARLDALDAKVITYLFGDLLPKVLPRS